MRLNTRPAGSAALPFIQPHSAPLALYRFQLASVHSMGIIGHDKFKPMLSALERC
jgi:hypothetical protein